jgi:hypothetical protein
MPTGVTIAGELGRNTDTSSVDGTNDKIQVLKSSGSVELATANQIYSGATKTRQLTVVLDDISTASSAFIASPYAGTISSIQTIIDGAIATADATITSEIGGTAVTGSSITVANAGSAAGDVDSATPSAANTLAVGDALEAITDGASTNTVKCTVTYTITLT